MEIELKRAYEPAASEDGTRILVERLWPRGVSKEAAAIDHWLKDVAPSTELRRWYGHDPERWPEFQRRYRDELDGREEAVGELRALVARGHTTFVFGSKEEHRNSAFVLREYLRSHSP